MAERRLRLALTAAALIAAGGLALSLLHGGGATGTGASANFSLGGSATGRVERRTLAERLTASGTIGYAGETTVLARLTGTVTALPAIGDVIRRGGRLYAVSGEPVLLFYGSVPAYRTLADGVSGGEDVEQLEANLAALGYEPGTVDEEFTYLTADAVAAWQEDLGLEVTGAVELGRIAFLRGPQRITALAATPGEALGAGGGGGANTMVAWEPLAEGLGEATEASEPQKGKTAPEEKDRGEPEGEDRRKPKKESRPPRAEKPKAEPDEEAKVEAEPPSVPVLRTSSTRRIVVVGLGADQQAIAHRGQPVEVVLPSGAEVRGRVTALTAVAASAGQGGPGEGETEPAIEATVAVIGRRGIPALDGASVNVLFTQEVRKHALSVPLTALIAIGGQRFAVYVREGGARRQVIVTPGLAADGYVEVKGKGLKPGMQVETAG